MIGVKGLLEVFGIAFALMLISDIFPITHLIPLGVFTLEQPPFTSFSRGAAPMGWANSLIHVQQPPTPFHVVLHLLSKSFDKDANGQALGTYDSTIVGVDSNLRVNKQRLSFEKCHNEVRVIVVNQIGGGHSKTVQGAMVMVPTSL
ncbi:hypothetical protein Fmac_028431 [Flemingia macrophylla]|uniref:Uncharacterized protein n=1 Tax=Flemingia macrophylla TaxID=520843 RepID=A0ABD1L7G6_9FABA